ncbi:SRPBCC family protein [Hoeflea sp.]|uniref:SRPBCC family protein n=1 Tax=Hoeflea sp. TaxID=1940281 RepID=UPI003B02C46D
MTAIVKTIWIDASPATVFEYLVVADKMRQWCGLNVRLEPVPGGLYELDMGEAGVITGRFLSVEPPTFLSYELEPPAGITAPSNLVEVRLLEQAGGTRVEITHTGLADPFPQIAALGWDHHLARLSVAATGGVPGPDTLCSRPMNSLTE